MARVGSSSEVSSSLKKHGGMDEKLGDFTDKRLRVRLGKEDWLDLDLGYFIGVC